MEKVFNGKKAFQHTKELSYSFGPRNSGSIGEHKAANYIYKEFQKYGLKTNKEGHDVTAYREKKCVLTVEGVGKIKAVPTLDSKSTPTNGIKADLYFCDHIDIHFLDKKEIKNKIIVTNMPGYGSYDNLEKIIQCNPKAIVFTMFSPDREPINYHRHDMNSFVQSKIPIVMIPYSESMILNKKRPKKGHLTFLKESKKSKSYNVIGELKGSEYPEEVIVICGHYDSCPSGPGASDNAAGTAIVLELARILAQYKSKRTIKFIAFGSEEIGLFGSKDYIRRLVAQTEKDKKNKGFIEGYSKTSMDNHLLCLNLDVHGYVIGYYNAYVCADKGTAQIVKALSCEDGPFFKDVKCGAMVGSDHAPFAVAGIPSVGFFRIGPAAAYMHSTKDEMKELSWKPMDEIGKYMEVFVKRYVCNALAFPFEREVPKDIVDDFKKIFERKGTPKDNFWEPIKKSK